MVTQKNKLTVTYFPYTLLSENDLKRLIPYFDTIRLLQVFPDSDPGLPDSVQASQLIQIYSPISNPLLLETLGRARRTYDQLAKVHQDGGLAHLLQTFTLQDDFEDSRTGLVAKIRQAHPRLNEEELEIVNEALFILLAHQFDYEHLELDLQLERIRGLEAKFQEEVGIDADEESEITEPTSPLLQESDPVRRQYSFQRLRAWTRLYWSQGEMPSFPALTTSPEVLSEIAERLPSEVAAFREELPAMEPARYLLSILPDTQSLSLEEVLEFRELLDRESARDKWRQSLTGFLDQLRQGPLKDDMVQETRHHLEEQAEGFRQLWPASRKPGRNLRLECLCYPNMHPEVAFALTSGLKLPAAKRYTPTDTNGITLCISPSAIQLDDRQS
jgi:hypothetical protein